MSGYRSRSERIGRALLIALCTLIFAFLVLPILAVIPLSLNPGSFLVFPQEALSLRWYRTLAESPQWTHAFGNSLKIAVATTLIATPLGTLAAIGLAYMRSRAKTLIVAIITAPLVVPVVVVAIAFYFLFAPLGLVNGPVGLIVAHSALALPFVVIVVHASLRGLDLELLRAAASLGAPPVTVLLRILAPLIAPGIAAGAVFAFMTSFDETTIALFIAGPEQRTLPIQMFEGVREQVSPAIAAAATLLVIASTLLLGTAELLRRRGERMRAGSAAPDLGA
ncbi:putative spermidine/putrescine transport system permease protein [Sphingopyxis panaciterrae]|uniref:ABC transporter permease n=1 Tax=Sphingopyxis panaciterrae TaxID=363841 RepID=UPI00142045C4|nr:ABC transporter permease [Sphingopyxis panaciterrae]NIJ39496.1 putative spermidine/putrescine transport system permease protein [Sphingopyxis panaciterrae]